MTQKEYIAASIKIIGLVALIYGCITLSRNLLTGGYSYYQSKHASISYADFIPDEMKKEFDAQNKSRSMNNQLMAFMYLAQIPVNIIVILFGLTMISKDHWFSTFLLRRNRDVQQSPPPYSSPAAGSESGEA